MPILDYEPGASPEAPGTLYFYEQGQDPSTGFQVTSRGVVSAPGGQTITGDLTVVNGSVIADSAGTAINAVDRGATSNFAAYVIRTAGVDQWSLQEKNDGTSKLYLTDSANGVDVLVVTPGATPSIAAGAPITGTGASSTVVLVGGLVAADTFDRVRVTVGGRIEMGPGNAARDTFLYRSGNGLLTTDGSVVLAVAGGGVQVKEGTNATMGLATLVAGTVTVNTTKVTANSRIFLTTQTSSGTRGSPGVTARVAGTSFTITSTSGTDTSTVAWWIAEPAA